MSDGIYQMRLETLQRATAAALREAQRRAARPLAGANFDGEGEVEAETEEDRANAALDLLWSTLASNLIDITPARSDAMPTTM